MTVSYERQAEAVAQVPKGLWLGGVTTPATGGATLPVENPATGEVFAEVADASAEDALAALDCAAAARDSWAAVAPRARGEILRRASPVAGRRRPTAGPG